MTRRSRTAQARILPDEASATGNEPAAAAPLADADARAEPAAAPPPTPPPSAPSAIVEPSPGADLAGIVGEDLGPGDRLLRFAYRAGISGGALQSPFRKPARPRLLATVANPLPGDPIAGTALRAGHFLIHGAKLPLDEVDFGGARLPAIFLPAIHGFAWLDDLAACAPREACAPIAEQIAAAWLDANPDPGKGPAWSVDLAAHRLMAWLIHAPLLLSGHDKGLRVRLLSEIAATARWLDRHVARGEGREAAFAGWCAIVAAGLLLPEGKPRRLYGEAGLLRAFGELVGDEGGVLSRSPLSQIDALAMLVRLAACYRALRQPPPEAIERMLAVLVPPLLGVLHGDGGLAGWQGAGAVEGERIAALVAASGVRARPLRDPRQWGYQRVAAGRSVLLFDAAPPPVARQARDGCASTLAFELSHGPERLIVSCGGAAYAGALVPLRLAQGLRATAAHSALVLDDANSTAVLGHGRLGGGVSKVELERRDVDLGGINATCLEASHDGYAARFGLTHHRVLSLREDGRVLAGEDRLAPAGRRGRRANVPLAIRFHLGPAVQPFPVGDDGRAVVLALPDGSQWLFRSDEAEVALDDSLWTDGGGRPLATRQLVIQTMVPRGGGSFAWSLEVMG